MIRLAVTLFAISLLALACGGGDSSSGDSAPVSAQGSQTGTPSAPGSDPAAAPSAALDPEAAGCLDLVAKGRFQQAIAPCTAALRAQPANQEVKDALARAQSEVSDASGAAKAQADASAQGVTDKLSY